MADHQRKLRHLEFRRRIVAAQARVFTYRWRNQIWRPIQTIYRVSLRLCQVPSTTLALTGCRIPSLSPMLTQSPSRTLWVPPSTIPLTVGRLGRCGLTLCIGGTTSATLHPRRSCSSSVLILTQRWREEYRTPRSKIQPRKRKKRGRVSRYGAWCSTTSD